MAIKRWEKAHSFYMTFKAECEVAIIKAEKGYIDHEKMLKVFAEAGERLDRSLAGLRVSA